MSVEEHPLVDVDRDEEDQRHAQADHRRVVAGGGGQDGGHGQPEEDVGRVLGDEHVLAQGVAVRAQAQEQRCQKAQGGQSRAGDRHREDQGSQQAQGEARRRREREGGQGRQGDQGQAAEPVPVGAERARADGVAVAQGLGRGAGQAEGRDQHHHVRDERRAERRQGVRVGAGQDQRGGQARQQQRGQRQRGSHCVPYREEVVAAPVQGEGGRDQRGRQEEEQARQFQGDRAARPEEGEAEGQAGQQQGPGRTQTAQRAAQRGRVHAQHREEGAYGEKGRQGAGERPRGHVHAQEQLGHHSGSRRPGYQQREADLDDLAEVVEESCRGRCGDRAAQVLLGERAGVGDLEVAVRVGVHVRDDQREHLHDVLVGHHEDGPARAGGGEQYVAVVGGDPVVHRLPALALGRPAGGRVERLGVLGEADALLHQALVAAAEAAEVALHQGLVDRDPVRRFGEAVDDRPGGPAGALEGGHVHFVDAYATCDQRGDPFCRLLGLAYAEVGEGGVQSSGEPVLLVGLGLAVSDEVEGHERPCVGVGGRHVFDVSSLW
ncbi:hypothetical protein OG352_20685 [Streptomyces sp. NBC_01485]|nr:hypothetical protein [Streptomyces sp. NBC_01485]